MSAKRIEPWQMTQEIFVTNPPPKVFTPIGLMVFNKNKQRYSWGIKGEGKGSEKSVNVHRMIVISAIRKGLPVPANVLKDYPDLKPQITFVREKTELGTGDSIAILYGGEYLANVFDLGGEMEIRSMYVEKSIRVVTPGVSIFDLKQLDVDRIANKILAQNTELKEVFILPAFQKEEK